MYHCWILNKFKTGKSSCVKYPQAEMAAQHWQWEKHVEIINRKVFVMLFDSETWFKKVQDQVKLDMQFIGILGFSLAK